MVMNKSGMYDDSLLGEALRVPPATGTRAVIKKPSADIQKQPAAPKAAPKAEPAAAAAKAASETTECDWGKVRIHTGTIRRYVQVWDHEETGGNR